MLQFTPGRKLFYAFVIAFCVTTVPIVHVNPVALTAATRAQQAASAAHQSPDLHTASDPHAAPQGAGTLAAQAALQGIGK